MRLFIYTILLIMTCAGPAIAQEQGQVVAQEIDSQRKILTELLITKEALNIAKQHNSALQEQISLYEKLQGLQKQQEAYLRQALEDRKKIEEVYEAKLSLLKQEIEFKDKLIEAERVRADRAEKSKNRKGLLYGLVGIILGSFL